MQNFFQIVLKWLFFSEIEKIAQRQGALAPNALHDSFLMLSNLLKTASAGYCTNFGTEKYYSFCFELALPLAKS